MSISLKIVDFNHQYQTTAIATYMVNDFDVTSNDERERLRQMIYTNYEGDSLKILPQCQCGAITGEYNVGVVCPDCKVVVMAVTERPLESFLWIRPLDGVEAMINPIVWTILSERMTHQNVNLLRWLCDPTMVLPPNAVKLPKSVHTWPLERGINAFYNNFETYIDALLDSDIIKGTKLQKRRLREFLAKWRHAIFTRYLPIPSSLNFITERTVTSTYVDTTMTDAIDAVWMISAAEHSTKPLSLKQRISRVVKANMLLANYYEKFIASVLVGKKGTFRKHVFGSRLHFTARAVIDSLSDNHVYDEIHIPWSLATMLLKIHLSSKLIKRGFTPNQSNQLLHEHAVKYNPLIDELFQELIREAPSGGIPVFLNRNPSLVRGSIQTLRITKVKTDPKINSISLSVLVLKAYNADFDGDALNLSLILDEKMHKAAERLAPHLGVLDLKSPRTTSNNIMIPAPVISTISNWVHEGR